MAPPKPLAPPLDAVLQPLPKGTGPDIVANSLLTAGPAIVYAIRRPGCSLCREGAQQTHASVEDLKAAGASRIVALVKEDLEMEVADFRSYWPGEIYLDKDLAFYKALGGGGVWRPVGFMGFLAMLANPFSSSRTKRHLKNVTAKGNLKGEGFGAGGCYVINPDGSAAYSFLEEEIGDHPPVADVLKAVADAAKAYQASQGAQGSQGTAAAAGSSA